MMQPINYSKIFESVLELLIGSAIMYLALFVIQTKVTIKKMKGDIDQAFTKLRDLNLIEKQKGEQRWKIYLITGICLLLFGLLLLWCLRDFLKAL